MSYYRFLFLEGSAAVLGGVETQLTAFRATLQAARAGDLRGADVDALRYPSARDPGGGVNVAVLDPSAFARRRPRGLETWHCRATRARVELRKLDYFRQRSLAFVRKDFLVRGRLPAPAF